MEEILGAQFANYRDLPDSDTPTSEHFTHLSEVTDLYDTEHVSSTVAFIDPGESGPMHAHEPPIEEFYFIVQGPVDLDILDPDTDEVATVKAETGDLFLFPPGVPHRPNNRYDKTAVELRFGNLSDEGDVKLYQPD